ncbi:MAG: hypothetical protein HY725_07770 [Candidatus Rokubacteria bacterium]|nr:hypothetical protein [Candidatus Rokubacteria bacterium]
MRQRVVRVVDERFDFTHDLIRQVVDGALLAPSRRLVHRRIASALEALHAANLEPHYAALGFHYREGEVWDKAVTYLRLAGGQAFLRSALREAATSYEQALEALRHLPESRERIEEAIDLRSSLRTALVPLGDFGRTFEHLREAKVLAERLGDQRRLGWLCASMVNTSLIVGDRAGALASGERALTIAAALGDPAIEAVANLYLGQTHFVMGDYSRARDLLERAVSFVRGDLVRERLGQIIFPSVGSRARLAGCLAEIGAFPEAVAHGEEALGIAESVDQPLSLMLATQHLGQVYLCRESLEAAIAVLERGLGLCRSHDIPYGFALIAGPLGRAYALSGRLAEAVPLLEQATERAVAVRRSIEQSLRVAWLAEAYLLAGRARDADRLARQALDLARRHGERGNEAWVLRLLGEIARHRRPRASADADDGYPLALALARELGMQPLSAHCHLGLGERYGTAGKLEQARNELAAAVGLYRAMAMTSWLRRAEAALSRLG